MKNYLIIGYGWLGKALAAELKSEGIKIFASTSDVQKLNQIQEDGFFGILVAKTSQVLSWNQLPETHFDKVIITLPPFEGVLESLNHLLNYLSFSQLVFTSSTGVYLESDSSINESSPVDESHLVFQMENCIRSLTKSPYQILRLAGHIGPNRHPLRYFLRHRRPISNGQAPVNLIHQSDMIAAIMILLQDVRQDSVYNLCWPEHPTKEKYYGDLVLKMGEEQLNFLEGNHGKKIDGSKITNETRFNYHYSIHEINLLDLRKDNI
jgi:nucleoside-diphosphate-sugar epimerase